MQKKICHIVFVLVLFIVSFNHYQFAKHDKRNNIDIHEDIYVNSSADYYYRLQGCEETDAEILPYNKIIGSMFYLFGKNFFVLRMTYLLFFLFFLFTLYLVMFLVFESALMALFVLLATLSVPGVISFSRICWPQIYSSSFLLLSFYALTRLGKNTAQRIRYIVLFAVTAFVSVWFHYASLVYLVMFLAVFILFEKKLMRTSHKKKYLSAAAFFFIAAFFYFRCYTYFETLKFLAIEFYAHLSWNKFISMFAKTDLFMFWPQFYFYYIAVFFLFLFMFFSLKDEGLKKLYGFFLCYLLTLITFFVWYPMDATVFGIVGGIIIVVYYFIFHAPLYIKFMFCLFVSTYFLLLNLAPTIILDDYNGKYCRDKTAIISDSSDWGMNELKSWAKDLGDRDVSVFVFSFSNAFYPENFISHITYFDLKMLSSDKKMNLLTSAETIDYLIFDDIYPVGSCFFNEKEYFDRYSYVRGFLETSLNFREVKRIKCPLKDIVIYKTFGVTRDFPG